VAAHLEIHAGRIVTILPASQTPPADQPGWDLRQGMVWPCFVDSHTHLDKAHTWPRTPNPDGTFEAALDCANQDRSQHWQATDLFTRMDFALRCSYAHGTQAVRTHLDSLDGQAAVSLPVFYALQEAWADKIALQAVCLVSMDFYESPEAKDFASLVAHYGSILGGVIYPQPGLKENIDRAFELAQARGLALDLHVDESLDPTAEGLRLVAEAKLRYGFSGPVTCAHCCSLSVQDEARAEETIALVKAAELSIVSLPMCNLYLQDRQTGRMPRYRGVTLLPELQRAGVPVALASDNCRDAFFAYGDHDMLEVFNQSVRIGQLDRPLGDWPRAITQVPAQIMNRPGVGQITLGGDADLVICKARNFNELLSRPQSDRLVLRQGRVIQRSLPDYAELDSLMTSR